MKQILNPKNNFKKFLSLPKKQLILLTVILVVFLDQVTKLLAGNYFSTVCNEGISFGIGQGISQFSVAALFIVLIIFLKEQRKNTVFSFSLIFAGGLSNVIDRAIIGCVRDFISVFAFPTFNLADAVITFGVATALFSVLKKDENNF